MGLALDELDEKQTVISEDGLQVMYDTRVKRIIDTGIELTVDFRESSYGGGFIIEGTGAC